MPATLSASLARSRLLDAWPFLANLPSPDVPALVMLGGVPLSGKTTLAHALTARARTRTLHVENDRIRERVVAAMHRTAPEYDAQENFLTYQTAWALVRAGLERGVNVIHDATNLDEGARRGAYEVADASGARTAVVLVLTPPEVRERRAEAAPPNRQVAAAKLGRRNPNPESVRRPLLVLDGAEPIDANLERLARFGPLSGLLLPAADPSRDGP